MANRKLEQRLEQLKSLRTTGPSATTLSDVSKALNDRVNLVVSQAAILAREWEAKTLLPVLLEAYQRLFSKASEIDPQCWGKNELARSLKELGVKESAPFLRGLQHRQWENTWGGKTDTATTLRGICALALVECTDLTRHDILLNLVEAATDSDAKVRVDAVRALEQMGGRDVSLILRMKARSGDAEPRVTGQILESLLGLEGPAGVPFVHQFLESASQETGEEAALALGASRLPEAVEALKAALLKPRSFQNRSTLLRAISSSRLDSAFDFLLSALRDARLQDAQDILWALQLHRDSPEIVERISLAIAERIDLKPLFAEIYQATR